jgi:O-antigen/teichoic acid export membrane protein
VSAAVRDRWRRGTELRSVVALTLSETGARLLSFLFYVVAARALTTGDFGILRYTTALAAVAFFAGQVLVTALVRELGAARGDPARTDAVLGSALAAAAAVVAVSCALAAIAAAAGLLGKTSVVGLVAALVGLAGFQLYYAIGRGLGSALHPLVTYVGGSLVQLGAFAVLTLVTNPGPTAALVVFGASGLVPIVALELWRPLVRGRPLTVRRVEFDRLWRLGRPLLAAEVGWLTWLSADQIWVASRLGAHDLGLYVAAKNVVQVFIALAAGVGGALLPRIAELQVAGDAVRARRVAVLATGCLLGFATLVGTGLIAVRGDALALVYGESYRAAAPALVGLTVGAVTMTGLVVITSAMIGWGRPRIYAIAICAAGVAEVAYLLGAGGGGIATAGWATAASMALGLVVAAAASWQVRRDRRNGTQPNVRP